MTVPHDLTADLPPPRDDEPASLRQDIVDELTDHLECALHRELLRGGAAGPGETASGSADSSFRTAHQTVLTRFGDPAAVARRLWRDAMKEKLMAQKISIVLASVAIAAVVFLSVVLQQTLQRAGEAQRLANEAQLALAQRQEQLSENLLKTLESLRPGPAAATTVDGWTPLTVKLVSEDGEAVQGEVSVKGTPIGGDKSDVDVSRSTGREGVAEYGMVPYGNYRMTVTATAAGETYTEHFMVAPGQPSERTIVCPASPPPEVEMRFAFNPPETLQTNNLRFAVSMRARPRDVGSGGWEYAENRQLQLWVDPSGQILKAVGHQFPAADFGLSLHGLFGLAFSPAPPLREYVYELQSIVVHVTNITAGTADYPAYVDEWTVAATHAFAPGYTKMTYEPRPGAENVWEIDIPQVGWEAIIDDLRKSPEARHVTIPDGWETVAVVGVGSQLFPDRYYDLSVLSAEDARGTSAQPVLYSAQLIAVDRRRSVGGFEFKGPPIVFMVTPEQKEVIETLKSVETLRFVISPAEEELESPLLREGVLEEVQQLSIRDDP